MHMLSIDYQVLNIQEDNIVVGWTYNSDRSNKEFQLQGYTIANGEIMLPAVQIIPVGNSNTFTIPASQLSTDSSQEYFYRLVAVNQVNGSVSSDITSQETYYKFEGRGEGELVLNTYSIKIIFQ